MRHYLRLLFDLSLCTATPAVAPAINSSEVVTIAAANGAKNTITVLLNNQESHLSLPLL